MPNIHIRNNTAKKDQIKYNTIIKYIYCKSIPTINSNILGYYFD